MGGARLHHCNCLQSLPAACCLLPAACCLLPAACCLLPAACCLLPAACCLLPAACCLLPRPLTTLTSHLPHTHCTSPCPPAHIARPPALPPTLHVPLPSRPHCTSPCPPAQPLPPSHHPTPPAPFLPLPCRCAWLPLCARSASSAPRLLSSSQQWPLASWCCQIATSWTPLP